jgi:hypothetical protein
MVPLKNKLWSQFSNEIQPSVEVLPDAVTTFRAVRIPAGVAHKARQIHEVAKVESCVWAPVLFHLNGSLASLCVCQMSVAA